VLATQVINKVNSLGASITLDGTGENLVIEPGSLLTPDLTEELRKHKPYIINILTRRELPPDPRPPIGNTGEVLEIARKALPELKEEDRVDLDELLEANSPPEPGRDSLVMRDTDKDLFFSREGWRRAWPRDFKVYRGGRA